MSEFSSTRMAANNPTLFEVPSISKNFPALFLSVLTLFLFFAMQARVFPQTYGQTYTAPTTAQTNYNDQSAVKQEIARLEIKVVRDGQTLPISQVPRIRKDDILKVRLLDEPVGGTKIDQTNWDWTLVVAYANPLIKQEKDEMVSQEINFRKLGWYKEYSFKAPFDCQPVFFLSPRANFRGQITKSVSKNYNEISKIGDRMVEISNAYAQINTFLDELQTVVNRNIYGYGASQYAYNPYAGQYNPYGGTVVNGSYTYPNTQYGGSSYGYASPYGYNQYGSLNQPGVYYQNPYVLDQVVERIAKSFNVQMPSCWYNNSNGNYNSYNSYSSYGTSSYASSGSLYGSDYGTGGSSYGGSYGTTYPTTGGVPSVNPEFNRNDFIARSQCVARTFNVKDFDISVTRMWQQGGVFLASELIKKYPQFATYINMAAVAIDFIVRAFQKSPIRLVPTMLVSADGTNNGQASTPTVNNNYNSGYQNNFQSGQNSSGASSAPPQATKYSIFSSSTPGDQQGFLTVYPVVIQKWQQQPDAEVVKLSTPTLGESCLHTGTNLLKNTNLADDWTSDTYTRDFKITMSSDNGFRKEFPLKKNVGLGGWELNLTPQDVSQIPKIAMSLEGQITGLRGFSKVTSDSFKLPVATNTSWEIIPETQKDFAVGARRRIAIRNTAGDCLCVQSVTYKPSFGGQFTFERGADKNALETSIDGKSVSFVIDTTSFNPGQGALEVRTFGGDSNNLNLKLYQAPPRISEVQISRGDKQIRISGERMEQLKFVVVNGYRATVQPNVFPPDAHNPLITTKLAIFDDPRVRSAGDSVAIELGLEDDRHFSYQEKFSFLPARPAIVADENNEISGISDAELPIREALPVKSIKKSVEKGKGDAPTPIDTSSISSQLIANHAAVFPIETKMITVNIQNSLADFEFKNEDISIETRLEKSQQSANDFIHPQLEVLDWKTLKLKFALTGDIYTQLGGRRIQFRFRDRARGDSDWYTIKQTFTRVPEIKLIKCTPEMNGGCELKGDGIDYVSQVSVDGGKTWYPGENGNLEAQPTSDGESAVMIPQLINRKLLRIKLRDYTQTAGLTGGNFKFESTVKAPLTNNFQLPAAARLMNEKKTAVPAEMQVNQGTGNSQAVPNAVAPAVTAAGNTPSPAPSQVVPDANRDLPRLPNPVTPPGQPNIIYTGAVQMMDEIIDMGPPKKP